MSTETPNLHLKKIEPNDLVTWREFNENCDTLDEKIKDLQDGQTTIAQVAARQDTLDNNQNLLAGRINNSEISLAHVKMDVAAVQQQIAEKASQADLDTLEARVTPLETDVTAIKETLADQVTKNTAFAQKDQSLQNAIDTINTDLSDKATKEELEERATEAETAAREYADGELAKKVDKVEGKGLSTNDYDNEAKAKVDKINDSAGRFTYDGEDFYTKTESDDTFIAIRDYQDRRALVFVGSNRTQQYRWAGKAQSIQVNYTAERSTDLNFWVEKQSKADFAAQLDTWQKIGGQIFNLPLNEVYMEFPVDQAIAAGDMVRLSMPEDDPDISVQVYILNDNMY